ncbi:MAG: hypothetical protein PVG14_01735 [Anaerolineales bacterium]|jgi:hypothetical protein
MSSSSTQRFFRHKKGHESRRTRVIRLLVTLSVFILLLLFLAGDQPARAQSNVNVQIDTAGGPDYGVRVQLVAGEPPPRGGSTSMTLTATPTRDAPDLIVTWVVPEGVDLVGPSVENFGQVARGETITSTRQLQFPEVGVYKIAADASFTPSSAEIYRASGVLFFEIDVHDSRVNDVKPNIRDLRHVEVDAQVIRNPIAKAQDATADKPCVTVSGNVNRVDRPLTPSGYGTNTTVSMANVVLELIENDILFDDHYGFTVTDSNGNYNFDEVCDGDGLFNNKLEIKVRLLSLVGTDERDVAAVVHKKFTYEAPLALHYGDALYQMDSPEESVEADTELTVNFDLDQGESRIFNILDAAFAAWQFWNDSGGENGGDAEFDYIAKILWKEGSNISRTFYNSFTDHIRIRDDASDPDAWDDSTIIHEWGHFADDKYGCDDNPGGRHNVGDQLDVELSFGEGYPDYYQSAVRNAIGATNARWYLDIQGSGNALAVDIENITNIGTLSEQNEFAVAGLFWDFNDSNNDGQDTVNHGHGMVQQIYTIDDFVSQPWDNDCDIQKYLEEWADAGMPTDAATAATVTQNTSLTGVFTTAIAQTTLGSVSAAQHPEDWLDGYRWWEQAIFILDNSTSMAGDKFSAVKDALQLQVSELETEAPEGVEMSLQTFNDGGTTNPIVFAGQFFADTINPEIASLTADGADGGCTVGAFDALAQAVDGQHDLDIWLFTDGDTDTNYPTVEAMQSLLAERRARASFALMGLCASTSAAQPEGSSDFAMQNALRSYLELSGLETPGGVVPYLLTAISSGGQFLFVDPAHTEDASEILRSLLTHSAGAGRWSDYVSDEPTYRFDVIPDAEYQWNDISGSGYLLPIFGDQGHGEYQTIIAPVTYYNRDFLTLRVYQNGYLTTETEDYAQPNNTSIPNGAWPNDALYGFWDDLKEDHCCDTGGSSYTYLYWDDIDDWTIVQYQDFTLEDTLVFDPDLTFQIQVNQTTGEIRYLYDEVPDASGATIGLEDENGLNAVQVAYNEVGSVSPGMGYKFTPVPPQPTRSFSVTVDSTMDSIGFLVTGFSGDLDPMVVRYPDGSEVDCSAADVLCLSLDSDGLVQYVQADVGTKTGIWQAEVSPGPGGEATFSFTSSAASPLTAESSSSRSRPTTGGQPLQVDLGQPIDGDTLTASFAKPDGTILGSTFTMYDDGAHADGQDGDGIYGVPDFTTSKSGPAYLTVIGTVGGETFSRTDPVPFDFQPLSLVSSGDVANYGGSSDLDFTMTNHDDQSHCYYFEVRVPKGWIYDISLPTPCLNPSESSTETVRVWMDLELPNTLPSATTGLVTVSAIEQDLGEITASDQVRVTRRRSPDTIHIFNNSEYLRPIGDTTTLEFFMMDEQDKPVVDGSPIYLSTTLGSLPAVVYTEMGYAEAVFTSGSQTGIASITASDGGSVQAQTAINIAEAGPSDLQIVQAPFSMEPISSAKVKVSTRDLLGDPVSAIDVRIGVESDDMILGSIQGSEVITVTTDSNGTATVTLQTTSETGTLGVRAEIVDNGGAVLWDRVEVLVSWPEKVYLPMVMR